MTSHSLKPNFGVNYDVGYVGFTSRSDDPVDAGIAWFERWYDYDQICVTHALIVSGPDECVEAHARTGVQKSTLSKYWNDPHCRLFFRKPAGWYQRLGEDIAISAQRHIGDKYGYGLIVADMLADTALGHWLNRKLKDWPNRAVSKLLNRAGTEVCSELAAEALKDNLPWLGCLSKPARMIEPQELFVNRMVFEDWKIARPVEAFSA